MLYLNSLIVVIILFLVFFYRLFNLIQTLVYTFYAKNAIFIIIHQFTCETYIKLLKFNIFLPNKISSKLIIITTLIIMNESRLCHFYNTLPTFQYILQYIPL